MDFPRPRNAEKSDSNFLYYQMAGRFRLTLYQIKRRLWRFSGKRKRRDHNTTELQRRHGGWTIRRVKV